MTDELRLVLVFVACILSAYSIGMSHGRAATYRMCKRMRADRRPWLVVMPLDRLLELIRDREIA